MTDVEYYTDQINNIYFNNVTGDDDFETAEKLATSMAEYAQSNAGDNYKLSQLAGGEWVVVDDTGTELAREKNRADAIAIKKDLIAGNVEVVYMAPKDRTTLKKYDETIANIISVNDGMLTIQFKDGKIISEVPNTQVRYIK